jgi:acyl carrier protein
VCYKPDAPIPSSETESMSINVATRTIQVISRQISVDPGMVTRDTRLDELGVDSLQLVEIIMELEDIFGIEIDQNAAEASDSLKDVGDIVDAVARLSDSKNQK